MPNQPIQLDFPLGGISRKVAYVGQPPHTTYDAQNVRPYDSSERRARGGTRPAIVAMIAAPTAGHVRLCASVSYVSGGLKECLVFVIGNQLYYSTNGTTATACGTALNSSTGELMATERLQKLYIAEASDGTNPIYVFDPTAPTTLTKMVAESEPDATNALPTGCTLIATYRDRLVLAGPGQLWYMSRQGEPDDYNYGADADDYGKAVAANLSDAGDIGEPITALCPLSDEQFVFGCTNSLWRLTGDPVAGGRLDNVSRTLGIVGKRAWCRGPGGELFLLTRDGVYGMANGVAMTPLSTEVPNEHLNINASGATGGNYVNMNYDFTQSGINLFITPYAGTAGTHWFFHLPTKSWWKEVYAAAHQPTAMCMFALTGVAAKVPVLGCVDGAARQFSTAGATDDGSTAIASYVKLGPIPLGGGGYHEGILVELTSIMDASSGAVTWEVMAGSSPEAAVTSTAVRATGSFPAGRGRFHYPQVRGAAASIKLSSSVLWQFEQVTATGRQLGKVRV